ncbi:MAG: histidinol-phosphate transaminase [Armatimonadetes bacterium]|nr:histidinol-phosphate transaminase [Armatimonadota bacterium]
MLPIRSNIKAMRPYSPGKPVEEVQRELGLTEIVKLASNENPLGPSPMAIKAVQEAALGMNVYPDASAFKLKQAIAAKFNVQADQVLVGNGSDELIHLLGLIFLNGPEDEIIVGDPSFVRYDASAQIAAAKLTKIPLDATLTHDLAAMADAVTPATRMIWVANPNNPTGTLVRRAEFERFLARVPEDIVIVLDEAYAEFAATEADYPSSLDYLDTGRVVGLRTFSKAYGLAGLRVGYGFAPAVIVDAIDRAREPFNVNALAQAGAIAALQDDDFIRRTIAMNAKGRDRLWDAFLSVGAKPVETYANFICADMGVPAEPLFEALLREGIIVRSGHVLGLPTYLRVSIGNSAEIDKFIVALTGVCAQV